MATKKKALTLTDSKMLKGTEVAKRLGMHPVSLSNMRQRVRYTGPPYMRLGKRSVRFPEDLLIQWMEKGLVMPDENERVA